MRTKYRDINGIRHEWCEDTKHYYLAESDGWTNYAGRRTCPECEGDAFITMTVEGILEDVTCLKCDGDGEIDFDPDDNPYAPDNWKEWEGIA